jgi:hypothetical protein
MIRSEGGQNRLKIVFEVDKIMVIKVILFDPFDLLLLLSTPFPNVGSKICS